MCIKGKIGLLAISALILTGCSCSTDKKVEQHVHKFSNEWSSYSGGHFHKCVYYGCDVTTEVKDHDYNEENICKICKYTHSSEYEGGGEGFHNWSSWEVIDAPTCCEQGTRERTCMDCSKIETATIDVDTVYGHNWLSDPTMDSEPTCQKEGMTGSKYCDRCYERKAGTVVPKINHEVNYDAEIIDLQQSKCSNCDYYEYRLQIYCATGYKTPDLPMDGDQTSTWNIGGRIKSGTYNIKICGKLSDQNYQNLKWYNMSKSELCINNEVEDFDGQYDNTSQDDYRYYLKINESNIYPNVTKSWGEIGLENTQIGTCEFINNVSISNVNTISLVHGNNTGSLQVLYVYFCKA